VERKKLLRKNFVVSEQGFYVYKGGVRSKVPIGGGMAARRHRSWLSEAL